MHCRLVARRAKVSKVVVEKMGCRRKTLSRYETRTRVQKLKQQMYEWSGWNPVRTGRCSDVRWLRNICIYIDTDAQFLLSRCHRIPWVSPLCVRKWRWLSPANMPPQGGYSVSILSKAWRHLVCHFVGNVMLFCLIHVVFLLMIADTSIEL